MILVVSYKMPDEEIKMESDAFEKELLWKFIYLSDTHSVDQSMYAILYKQLKQLNPEFIFHGGDLGWNQHNTSKYHRGDYRYQPLKGLIEMQQLNPDLQIHVASGNHDIIKEYREDRSREHYIVDGLEYPACRGDHFYWGEANEPVASHYALSDLSLNPEVKSGFRPFNNIILDKDFCNINNPDSSYSFIAGNIKFVIIGWDKFRDLHESEKDRKWLIDNVCLKENSNFSKTIIIAHSLRLTSEVLGNCNNNIALILQGHVHEYTRTHKDGFEQLVTRGVLISGDNLESEYSKRSDFLLGSIYKDNIKIERYHWGRSDLADLSVTPILTIQGDFIQLEDGQKDNYELEEFNYNLKRGFQIIGFPFNKEEFKASELFNLIKEQGGEVSEIGTFSKGQMKVYRYENDSYTGDDFFISENTAVSLINKNNYTLKIDSRSSEFNFNDLEEYNSGWHLVSFPNTVIDKYPNSEDILNELEKFNVDSIYLYKDSKYNGVVRFDGNYLGRGFKLTPTEGYWIRLD